MSILDISISGFSNHFQREGKSVNLLKWLTSGWYFERQRTLLDCEDPDRRQALKASMPVIMPSLHDGEHTGLLSLDIDGKDNRMHIDEIKSTLVEFAQVAYLGRSVSYTGLWCLIPIANPDNHLGHFMALERIFSKYGIKVDSSGKNVNRLRYYSHDPEAYFNHEASVFTKTFKLSKIRSRHDSEQSSNIDVIGLLEKHGWQQCGRRGQRIDFTRPGKQHGISANFRETDRVFYVFTSSTDFEPGRGYNPFSVYALLEHGGNFNKAKRAITKPKSAELSN